MEKELYNIERGDKVKDFYHNSCYEFVGVADFSISEVNDYMQCSIVDYYKNKNQSYIVEKLNPNTKAVLVSNKHKNIFPYIPNRLKKICTLGNLSSNALKQCNQYIKLNANEKMKLSIDLTQDILKNSLYIKFDKRNMLIESLDYTKSVLKKPNFIFGNNGKHNTILYGLPQNRCYENKKVEIKYFIDPDLLKDKSKFEKVKQFSLSLEKLSQQMGVELNRQKSNVDFKTISIDNKDKFECDIRRIVESYNNPVIVIMEDKNCETYYASIKKIFGNKHNIATQFIEFNNLNYNEKSKEAILLNILLGIYGKSGIQPWILEKPLDHLVVHRDGISREELEILKNTANNLGIKFEYVEITKDVNRRIANFDSSNRLWQTQMGAYYYKENLAYIATTNPYSKIGMAKPLRIRRVHGEQPIEKIVEDVYKLSFMHIGSILKSRLPITTHYADLSSTYGNREWMPTNIDSNSLHFI